MWLDSATALRLNRREERCEVRMNRNIVGEFLSFFITTMKRISKTENVLHNSVRPEINEDMNLTLQTNE
jgi:hypothetical protein